MKQMIKRKDGSVSQRGLWDNMRAAKGSGKKPTAQMLKQEKKIKAKSTTKAESGGKVTKAKTGAKVKDNKWIQKAVKTMRTDKPCTGPKFGSKTCPPGSKRYNLAKTFKKMSKKK